MSTVTVNRAALVSLLDYVQPDEEHDFANLEEGNSAEHHIVHAIRALRASSEHSVSPDERLAPEHFDIPVTVTVEGGGYYQGFFSRGRSNGMVTITPDEDGDSWADLNPDKIVSITHHGDYAFNATRRQL